MRWVQLLTAAVAGFLWTEGFQTVVSAAADATDSTGGKSSRSVRSVDFGAGCHSNEEQQRARSDGNASFEVHHRGAQFLVFHFRTVRLDPTATITILDLEVADEEQQQPQHHHQYHRRLLKSFDHKSIPLSNFFTPPVYSSHIVIQYTTHANSNPRVLVQGSPVSHSTGGEDDTGCFGFYIDEYRFAAFTPEQYDDDTDDLPSATEGEGHQHNKAAQGDDDSEECTSADDESKDAACFAYNTQMFEASRPVARLLIQKSFGAIYCTGWLFGCEGHVLTNHHCVSQESDANATTIEFLAQGATCAQQCNSPALCPGNVVASSAQIVAFSVESELDFTLLLPRLSPAQRQQMVADYGFLSMRADDAVLSEQIFIPQHPAGLGKRIALKHNGQYGVIVSRTESSCNARSDNLGYLLDTRGGSSGAPVIASSDTSVVGLHFCGGCRNSAIPAQQIMRYLESAGALPSCALSELQWPPADPEDE